MNNIRNLDTLTNEQIAVLRMTCIDVLKADGNYVSPDCCLKSCPISIYLLHMLEDLHLIGKADDFFTAVMPPKSYWVNITGFTVCKYTSSWLLFRTWDWWKEHDSIVKNKNSDIMRRFYRMYDERKRMNCVQRLKARRAYANFTHIELTMLLMDILVPTKHKILSEIGWNDTPTDEEIADFKARNFISKAPTYEIYESEKPKPKA